MVVAPEAVIRLSPAAARSVVAVVAGLFGLFIGSFLNVVIYRVPRGLSIVRPRSFCPSCGTPVRPVDNVPVLGWLALGGKCRSCRSPISPRYPLVEGLTGGLFASIGLLVGPHLTVPALCVLAATFVPLVAIELDRQASPPGVSLIGGGLGLALFVIPSARSGNWGPLVSVAAG
ncbi:MAG TPA: prepilin peptidase, partial [Acidimicrobiales bacterium]|nr:prepilin peptidase [Acidimicrobiales bacterium]